MESTATASFTSWGGRSASQYGVATKPALTARCTSTDPDGRTEQLSCGHRTRERSASLNERKDEDRRAGDERIHRERNAQPRPLRGAPRQSPHS